MNSRFWIFAAATCVAALFATEALAGESVPAPDGATLLETKSLPEGGEKRAFKTDQSPAEIIAGYAKILGSEGWTITSQGTGAGPKGGGGQLVADHEGQHVVLKAGGPDGATFIGLCVWPKRPANDYCG